MSTYDETIISDATILADKPITQGQGRQFRENLKAVFQGDVTSPGVARKGVKADGAAIDGAWIDTTDLAGFGYYEPLSILWTAARSGGRLALPLLTVLRVSGNVAIGCALTGNGVAAGTDQTLFESFNAMWGLPGASPVASAGGGGGNVGAGGTSYAGDAGGAAKALTGARWPWYGFRPRLGAQGGNAPHVTGGAGGGCLIMLVEGSVDLTGGSIDVSGLAGSGVGAVDDNGSGGGSGGTIIIVATGDIKGGTLHAKGGAGGNKSGTNIAGGGGGGGYIALVAGSYSVAPTVDVSGAVGYSGAGHAGTNGADGQYDQLTLTNAQIRALLFRSY